MLCRDGVSIRRRASEVTEERKEGEGGRRERRPRDARMLLAKECAGSAITRIRSTGAGVHAREREGVVALAHGWLGLCMQDKETPQGLGKCATLVNYAM